MFKKVLNVILLLLCMGCIGCIVGDPPPIPDELLPLEGDWNLVTYGVEPKNGTLYSKSWYEEWELGWPRTIELAGGEEVECMYGSDSFSGQNDFLGEYRATIDWCGGLVANLPFRLCKDDYTYFVVNITNCKMEEFNAGEWQGESYCFWYFNFENEDTVLGIVQNYDDGWSDFRGTRR